MAFATASDSLLHAVLLSGLAVFLLTLALLLVISLLRFMADRRARLDAVLAARWQPVFFQAIEGLPHEAPRIHGRDREVIMRVWLQFTELLRGEGRVRLSRLAHELQLVGTALRLLQRGDVRGRLLAVVGLGRMQAEEGKLPLQALMNEDNPVLSLLAARSLLQIDPRDTAAAVLAAIGRRGDWSLARVAAMLGEVDAALLGPRLLEALAVADAESVPRLLALLDTVNVGDRWPVLEPLLYPGQPVDTLAAALKVAGDPRALGAARALAAHAAWPVRAQAAAALGRLGGADDAGRLRDLLGDAEWWVRYRAALALVRMPGVNRAQLDQLAAGLHDPFAADMLRQVLAETGAEAAR